MSIYNMRCILILLSAIPKRVARFTQWLWPKEMESVTQIQILDEAISFSFCTSVHEKSMNQFVLPLSYEQIEEQNLLGS